MSRVDDLLAHLEAQASQEWYRWVVDVWAKRNGSSAADPNPPDFILSIEQATEADAEAIRREEADVGAKHRVYDPGPEMSLIQSKRACRSELGLAAYLGLEWTGKGQQGIRRRDVADFYEVRAVGEWWKGLAVKAEDEDAPFVLALVIGLEIWWRGWEWTHDVRVPRYLRPTSSRAEIPFWLKSAHSLQRIGALPSPP